MTAPTLPVEPNAVECLDCMEITADPTRRECEYDLDHAMRSAYVSKTPLRDAVQDEDFYHFGREQYEYTGEPDLVIERL